MFVRARFWDGFPESPIFFIAAADVEVLGNRQTPAAAAWL